MTDQITVGFMLLIIALVTVFDIWTLARRGYSTTISWQIYVHSKSWPVIPFLFGLLAGHLFFPNRAGNEPTAITAPVQP